MSTYLQSNWFDMVGRNDAPALILLHGSVVNRAFWREQVNILSDHFHILVPDLPGHGALRHVPFRFENALDMLANLIVTKTDGQAMLAGISLGGHVATLLAAREPKLVDKLVVSGASMNFRGAMGIYIRMVAWLMRKLVKPDRLEKQAINNMRAKWPAETVDAIIAAGVAPLGAAQSFEEIWKYDFQKELANAKAPVMILNGEFDRPNRRNETVFASATRNSCLETVPNAGHACNIENSTEYNRRLLRFLNPVTEKDKIF